MDKFIVQGGKKLKGTVKILGSKNVALKALVAACLTDEETTINNIPLISDLSVMTDIIKELGGEVKVSGRSAKVRVKNFKTSKVIMGGAAKIRTSAMFIAPLLIRRGKAEIPSPGGDKVGARPIDRIINGAISMGANVGLSDSHYKFVAKEGLNATTYCFPKNTHMGTETLILCSVLTAGTTVLKNAAEEPEVDSLIELLGKMGAKVKRNGRVITITGVAKLRGVSFDVPNDRNEAVTFGVAALITEGDITMQGIKENEIAVFLEKVKEIGGGVEVKDEGVRIYYKGQLASSEITTSIYPGFMTDWQAPWAVLMTKANGVSSIHETIFEDRFGYVEELIKMGAKIESINLNVPNPDSVYNFNIEEPVLRKNHAIKIYGPTNLSGQKLQIPDLRAGATLVLAALASSGTSEIYGVGHIDRGYERFEKRLNGLGANIRRIKK